MQGNRLAILKRVMGVSLFTLFAHGMPFVASAQVLDVQAIVAVVNDEVVSRFDVDQRVLIVTNGAQVADSVLQQLRTSALQTIIDERLQIQEAINVNPEALAEVDLEDSLARLRERNNMSEAQFEGFMEQLGVEREAFETRALAETLWSRLVSGRLGPQAAVSDSEVRAVQSRLERNVGEPEHHLSEIFLPVDYPEDDSAALEIAERTHQSIRDGQAFDVVARSVSSGTTASEGGDIGWIPSGALLPEIEDALVTIEIGEISPILRGESGYYIFLVRNRQIFGDVQALGDVLSFRAIMWKFDQNMPPALLSALQTRAEQVSGQINECGDVFDITERSPLATAAYFGDVRVLELPAPLSDVILALEPNDATAPIVIDNTLYVFSLCGREEPASPMPTEEAIQDQIFQQKLNMLARRYLRDLHAVAIIDIR